MKNRLHRALNQFIQREHRIIVNRTVLWCLSLVVALPLLFLVILPHDISGGIFNNGQAIAEGGEYVKAAGHIEEYWDNPTLARFPFHITPEDRGITPLFTAALGYTKLATGLMGMDIGRIDRALNLLVVIINSLLIFLIIWRSLRHRLAALLGGLFYGSCAATINVAVMGFHMTFGMLFLLLAILLVAGKSSLSAKRLIAVGFLLSCTMFASLGTIIPAVGLIVYFAGRLVYQSIKAKDQSALPTLLLSLALGLALPFIYYLLRDLWLYSGYEEGTASTFFYYFFNTVGAPWEGVDLYTPYVFVSLYSTSGAIGKGLFLPWFYFDYTWTFGGVIGLIILFLCLIFTLSTLVSVITRPRFLERVWVQLSRPEWNLLLMAIAIGGATFLLLVFTRVTSTGRAYAPMEVALAMVFAMVIAKLSAIKVGKKSLSYLLVSISPLLIVGQMASSFNFFQTQNPCLDQIYWDYSVIPDATSDSTLIYEPGIGPDVLHTFLRNLGEEEPKPMKLVEEQGTEIWSQVEQGFTIKTKGTERDRFGAGDEALDNTVGSTVEVRLKLITGPQSGINGAMLALQDGRREGKLSFFDTRIEIIDKNELRAKHLMDTTDGFHTYRMAIMGNTMEVYVDGNRVASVGLGYPVTGKRVLFGDYSDMTGENADMQVHYVAYSVERALRPKGAAMPALLSEPEEYLLLRSPAHPGRHFTRDAFYNTEILSYLSYLIAQGEIEPVVSLRGVPASKYFVSKHMYYQLYRGNWAKLYPDLHWLGVIPIDNDTIFKMSDLRQAYQRVGYVVKWEGDDFTSKVGWVQLVQEKDFVQVKSESGEPATWVFNGKGGLLSGNQRYVSGRHVIGEDGDVLTGFWLKLPEIKPSTYYPIAVFGLPTAKSVEECPITEAIPTSFLSVGIIDSQLAMFQDDEMIGISPRGIGQDEWVFGTVAIKGNNLKIWLDGKLEVDCEFERKPLCPWGFSIGYDSQRRFIPLPEGTEIAQLFYTDKTTFDWEVRQLYLASKQELFGGE